MDCYRVSISRGNLHLRVVITAPSPDDARARAMYMAEDLLERRVPWRIEAGRWQPVLTSEPVVVSEAALLHRRGEHR